MARSGKSALHDFKPRLKVLQYIQFPCIGLSKYINLTEDFQLRKPSNISRRNSFKCNSNPCSWFVNLQMNIRLPVLTVVVTISLKRGLANCGAIYAALFKCNHIQCYLCCCWYIWILSVCQPCENCHDQKLHFPQIIFCNFPQNYCCLGSK